MWGIWRYGMVHCQKKDINMHRLWQHEHKNILENILKLKIIHQYTQYRSSILEVRNLRGISQNLLPFMASIVTHRTSTVESQVRLHVPDFGSSPGAFAARNGRTPQGQDCWANRDLSKHDDFLPKNGNLNEETWALEHDEHGNERWNGAASFQTNLTGSPSAWQSHCLKPV